MISILDFKQELDKLINARPLPPAQGEFSALAHTTSQSLSVLSKKQSELALQVEEVYDIISSADTDELQKSLASEHKRADSLAGTCVGLCDILEDFYAFACESGDSVLAGQARMMWRNAAELLERRGFVRLGEEGEALDTEKHTVQSITASAIPREHVARVLQSGYRYLGEVARKATVVVSAGAEESL